MKVDYTVKIIITEDNISKTVHTELSHKTEFNQNVKELANIILKELEPTLKEKYPNSTAYIIAELIPTYKYIEDNKLENSELLEESKNLWKQLAESKEFRIIELENSYNQIIAIIMGIRETAKQFDLLNTQKFLDFMDTLNKLSIDPDPTK